MQQVPVLSPEAKQRLEAALSRAAEDIQFRNQLMRDPKTALAGSGLSGEELEVLSSMRRVALEEWGLDVRRFRAFLRDNGAKVTNG